MGMSRITVVVVGNHGCQRDKKGTDVLAHCGEPTCLDCIAREYVAKLKSVGGNVQEAHIHHWPSSSMKPSGNAGDVVDNLLIERRLGSFGA